MGEVITHMQSARDAEATASESSAGTLDDDDLPTVECISIVESEDDGSSLSLFRLLKLGVSATNDENVSDIHHLVKKSRERHRNNTMLKRET
ncbi:hypothetical protein DMENIID0001_081070 [Sergentomyia squamirostris]